MPACNTEANMSACNAEPDMPTINTTSGNTDANGDCSHDHPILVTFCSIEPSRLAK